jgi:hypothetical protein
MAPPPPPVTDANGHVVRWLRRKNYGWLELGWKCILCKKQATDDHLLTPAHKRNVLWWEQNPKYYEGEDSENDKYAEMDQQYNAQVGLKARPPPQAAPSPGTTAEPCTAASSSTGAPSPGATAAQSELMKGQIEHAQQVSAARSGPTAAPPAASTVHVIMAKMRENTELIQKLVRQVSLLAQENSQQIRLCEDLLLSESGGSDTLQ